MIDLHATKNINFGEVNASTSFTVHVDKFKIITFEEYAQKRTLYRSFVYKPMLVSTCFDIFNFLRYS
jgi:hypothetical protein